MTFFIAIAVPLYVAFKIYNLPMVVLPQIFFITDILFNFRTTYIDNGGQIVYQSKRIVKNYVKSWLFIDVVSALPLELMIDDESSESSIAVSSNNKQ